MGTDSHFAAQELCLGDVAYGSFSPVPVLLVDVRFTPGSCRDGKSATTVKVGQEETSLHRGEDRLYSITSSAMDSTSGDTVMSIAFRMTKVTMPQ